MFERNGQKLGSVIADAVAGPSPDETPAVEGYEAETVATLKELLGERDLPTSGNKAELIERLTEDDDTDPKSDEPETKDEE